MRTIKMFILKKNLLIRIILSYLFVGLLIISVLTIIITSKVSENLTQEITNSTDRAIEQSYNTANILLNSTYNNFASVYASADIQTAFYSEDFGTSEMGRIGNKLYEVANTNPLVHSVYLFNYQKKIVFSSLSTVRTFDDFYDPKMIHMLESTQPYRFGIFIPRHVEFKIDGKAFNNNLISIPYLSFREDRITNGAMVLNLDQQVLQNLVMNGTASRSFQSMIINRQGMVISHSDSSIFNANLSEQSYVKEISAASSQKGTLEITLDGKDSRVFYIKSDSLGWTFIGVINYESLLGKVNEIKRYILWVTAVMLVVVIVAGGIFTRMIYGPIHRLITNVSESPVGTKERQAVSEFDLLSGTFTYLAYKIQDLQTSVADYQSAKRHEVLRLLTKGGLSNDEEMARKLKNVGIEFKHPNFIICLLRLDSYRELLEKYSPLDISLFKFAVSNIADELGASSFQVVSFEDGEDVITLVVNVRAEMANQEMDLKTCCVKFSPMWASI